MTNLRWCRLTEDYWIARTDGHEVTPDMFGVPLYVIRTTPALLEKHGSNRDWNHCWRAQSPEGTILEFGRSRSEAKQCCEDDLHLYLAGY